MHIGILRERKQDERRVALRPSQAKELIAEGHTVWVESGAGQAAQYPDRAYQEAGATIADKTQVLAQCKLLLKVKCPIPEEYGDFRADHVLFTYLHFDENIPPEQINALTQSGLLGIAYEWVERDNDYPLLEPMSRLTGHLFYQRSVELLAQHKGILAGSYGPELPGAKLLILGLGRIGTEVLRCALMNRLNAIVVARDEQKVKAKTQQVLQEMFGMGLTTKEPFFIPFDNDNPAACREQLNEVIPDIDIVINCAVRRSNLSKEKLPYLVDKSMIQQMQPYSVVCDATACDRDFIETCVSSEILAHYDLIDEVVHYSPDHIPSYVPKTSTDMLTAVTFDYIKLIANLGPEAAIRNHADLRSGVACYKGQITHPYTARKKGYDCADILELLA